MTGWILMSFITAERFKFWSHFESLMCPRTSGIRPSARKLREIKAFCQCELSPWKWESAGVGIWMICCDNGLPNANELNSVSASGSDPPNNIPKKLLLHTNSLSTQKRFYFSSRSPVSARPHITLWIIQADLFILINRVIWCSLHLPCASLCFHWVFLLVFFKDSLIFLFITPK